MSNSGEAEVDCTDIATDLPEDDHHDVQDLPSHTLMLAATYIEDARSGWKTSLHFEPTPRNLRFYLSYRAAWTKYLLYVVLTVHMGLALIEWPSYFNVDLHYMIPACVEICCLAYYVYRCLHLLSFTSPQWFWKDVKNLAVISVILLVLIDMIVYVGLTESGLTCIRWSRPLRPLLIIYIPESRQVRRACRSVVRTLPDVFGTMVLFVLNLLLFALIGFKLFGTRKMFYANGRPYFTTFEDSVFDLYVLVTTANSPDIMMPVLNTAPAAFIYFVAFILVSLYLFMNVILAVMYNSYRKHLKVDVQMAVSARRQLMGRAFSLLTGGGTWLRRDTYVRVMVVLRRGHGPQLVEILWRVLDEHSTGQLNEKQFYQLADLLNVRVTEVKDRVVLLAWLCPRLYNSRPSVLVRHFVHQRLFRIIFDLLIFVNAIMIAVNEDAAEWAFLVVFMLEILLKMYAFGFREFFDRLWNVFDFIVIGGACVITPLGMIVRPGDQANTWVLDVLLLLRVLRVVKLMYSVHIFRVVLRTINSFSRSVVTYAGVLFCLYYFFALLGMELFAGRVSPARFTPGGASSCGDSRLRDTDFGRLQYCANNFNDLTSALTVLFELMVVNQWHVLADGFAAVSSRWARLYFVAFHLCCVVLVLNIFTAFVLEAFMLEFAAEKTSTENKVVQQITQLGLGLGSALPPAAAATAGATDPDGPYATLVDSYELDADHERRPTAASCGQRDLSATTGVRFHIGHRPRSVEVILQRMFESEETHLAAQPAVVTQ